MAEDHSKLPAEKGFPDYDSMLDEETLLRLFTERVEALMSVNIDLLLSSLYRLDVEEEKIQEVLRSTTIPHAEGIARLILERQKERLKTRKLFSGRNTEGWF